MSDSRSALTDEEREVLTRMKLDIDAHRWDAYRPEDVSVLLDIIVTLDARLAALPDSGERSGLDGRIDITEHAECLDSECGAAWLIRREDQWRQRVIEAEAANPTRDAQPAEERLEP
jgi:hypothetical protein